MKKIVIGVSIAALAGILTAHAQIIIWQSPQVTSSPTDVLTNGTYFGSWAPYDGGASGLPVNGVTFQGFSDLPNLTTSFVGGQNGYNQFGSPGTSDANYNSLLQYAAFANGDGITFSWGGMRPGHTYEVQFWVNDSRGVTGARWENLSGGAVGTTAYGTDTSSPAGYSSPVFSGAASAGYYIVGTFVADSSGSEEILVSAFGSSSTSAQINLLQVRDITTPAAPLPFGGYSAAVMADTPLAYYRLNEAGPLLPDIATNSGSLSAVGNATNFPGARHQAPGAIVGDPDTAMTYSAIDTNSDDGGVPTIIPYNAALNPAGSFTVEAWLRPTEEGAGNAQCPLFNCQASTEDYGWDFYQRASVAGSGQQGWEFYMNNATGARVGDAVGGTYTVGQWGHLVAVYDANAATATLYVDGQQVAQATGITGYVPNPSFPMSVGGYWDGSQNPFVGDIDEFAFYATALSSAQVLAHYQNGTNASRSVSYSSLVKSDGALEYLRLDEPAVNVATNSGSLAALANGVDSNTGTPVSGPAAPIFPGFEAANLAESFTGSDYIELLNPAGLNFTGPIALEAWIQPTASQGSSFGDVIAHGVNDSGNAEVVLRLNGTNTYQVSSWDGNNSYGVTAAIPPQDVSSGNWVHLVGTYDGGSWNLYRNGVLAASAGASTGSLMVSNANWAIGARGRWKNGGGYPLNGLDRQFQGAIDEVAIYNHALTPDRVLAHYNESKQPLTISVSNPGRQVTLNWVLGTLVHSTNVAGPYQTVTNASSPYHPLPGPTHDFFRIQY